MPRLFLGNFDFEIELVRQTRGNLPDSVRRMLADLVWAWLAVAEDGDWICTPAPMDAVFRDSLHTSGLPVVLTGRGPSEVPPGLELVAWGWTPSALRWGEQCQAIIDAPPPDVVRRLNSRGFSWAIECAFGLALPGAARIGSVEELQPRLAALLSHSSRWVVKSEFSHAGREQFLHRPGQTSQMDELTRWARRRLVSGQILFLEPWVESLAEVGIQMTVLRDAEPRLEGVTSLLCDATGAYRGSEFSPGLEQDPLWESAIETALAVARLARDAGYFGPLGIDAMRFRDAQGQEGLRPIQDINARWTMGRLSLGWRRWLQPGERGVWLTGETGGDQRLQPPLAPGLRSIALTPSQGACGGRGFRSEVRLGPADLFADPAVVWGSQSID